MRYLYLIESFSFWFCQGKRGIEKPPFQLPDFIAATGIEKIRQVIQSFARVFQEITCSQAITYFWSDPQNK